MIDRWKDNQKVAFFSCMLIGLITHGYMYFNKLSWHDDMTLTHIGGTYVAGRWFLGVIEWLVNQCGGYYSLPVLQGCVSLFFIALSAMLVVDMLKITKKPLVVLTAGMMIAIPVMTALYAYMFTAAAYSLSIFLSILGVYFTWKIKGIQGILLGMGAICLGMGCYQAYVSAAVCVVCMISYLDIVDNPDIGLRKLVGGVFKYACTLLGGFFLYLIVNQVFLDVLNTRLSDYQGISSMGSFESLLPGIKRAYLEFICPTEKLSYCMYMGSLKKVYFAVLLLGGLLAFGYCIKIYKKNKCNMLIATIIILFFPIAVNFVFLMGSASVHSLMTYSQVMVFVMLSALTERVAPTKKAFGKILRGVSVASLGYALAFYINYDNQCYLKATFQQESTISWMTTLVTQIKQTEGYSVSLPVAWINAGNVLDKSRYSYPEYADIYLMPYDSAELYNDYMWRKYMASWTGFNPDIVIDVTDWEMEPEVINMPSYPDYGSIKVIDNVIIVKF